MVCDPELTRQVLRDDDTFDKGGPLYERVRDLLGNGLGTCPYPLHRRQRRLCQPAFQRERLRAYATVMAADTQAAVDSWHDGQVIDVAGEMMKLTARAAVATMFSSALPAVVVDQIVADFTTLLDAIIRRVITPQPMLKLPTPANRRYHQALIRLRGTVAKIVAARRAGSGEHGDLLSALMTAADPADPGTSSRLSDTELADQVLTFLITGTEPTAATVSFAVHLLATHPGIEISGRAEVDRVLNGEPIAFDHLPELTQITGVITETLQVYRRPLRPHRNRPGTGLDRLPLAPDPSQRQAPAHRPEDHHQPLRATDARHQPPPSGMTLTRASGTRRRRMQREPHPGAPHRPSTGRHRDAGIAATRRAATAIPSCV
ncbi:cytochrome P450 [Streptomyces sp. NPDC101150]|uniref:cytochrome P450 n=1 Tax=Streptomyces sp. NPDC101150 TaxID=3366114 RepID=UPI003811E470